MAGRAPGGELRFATRALGSALRLTVRLPVADGRGGILAAERAWSAVRAEFDAVDRAMSRFRDDSELTMLNRVAGTGDVVRVSRRLRSALAAADRAHRLTGGRFDARVLGALERIGERGADLAAPARPTPGEDLPTRAVQAPAAPVDLGGIGKGLALRWAAAAALPHVPEGGGLLLEAGGDVVAAGEPPDGGWLVGIEDPAAPGDREADPIAVVALAAGAVATSSVRVRHWVGPGGRPVHHLLDPFTGEPARTGLIAVTVAAADPAWSEVWSKALFLAGRSSIGAEARARGLAAWWIDAEGHLGMTPDARIRSAWVAESRLG